MAKNVKLSALLKSSGVKTSNDIYQVIALNKIQPDPNQPRKEFKEEALKELSESIIKYGVMQPIIVAKIDDNKYVIRQGERRYRASLLAQKNEIPVIIDTDNKNVLEKQLIENIARENLSVSEIAESIRYLVDDKKMKKKDLASALAKSNSFVSNYYAFASFDHELKPLILEKTQDLIIITDFKRLIENADKEKYNVITHFLDKQSSINRDDMNLLKNKLDKLDSPELNLFEAMAARGEEGRIEHEAYPVYEEKDGEEAQHKSENPSKVPTVLSKTASNAPVTIELSRLIDFLKEILPADISKHAIKKIKKEFGSN